MPERGRRGREVNREDFGGSHLKGGDEVHGGGESTVGIELAIDLNGVIDPGNRRGGEDGLAQVAAAEDMLTRAAQVRSDDGERKSEVLEAERLHVLLDEAGHNRVLAETPRASRDLVDDPDRVEMQDSQPVEAHPDAQQLLLVIGTSGYPGSVE